jgi:tetratricopeptide (TPR) repeat protein
MHSKSSLINTISQQIKNNEIILAVRNCEELNKEYPECAQGWYMASILASKIGKKDVALGCIDKALKLNTEDVKYRLKKIESLLDVNEFKLAGKLAHLMLKRSYENASDYTSLGLIFNRLNLHKKSLELYQNALALDPMNGTLIFNIAMQQRFIGQLADAEESLDRALSMNPNDSEAQLMRSSLKKQTPESNHTSEIEDLLRKENESPQYKVQLSYALAKEYEDIGEYKKSFDYLNQGASTRRGHMNYDVQNDVETINTIMSIYQAGLFDGHIHGNNNDEPVFIVGLPRTGTTLVERILSSHSMVFSAGELNQFATQLMRLAHHKSQGKKLPRAELIELTKSLDFTTLGSAYIDSTRYLTGHTPHFIDKLPLNFLYVGLIHLALPNAKIINLNRHPIATCYSVYKYLFTNAYPFSYDLEDMGRYYVAYYRLMEHWNSVMPGVIYTVSYEELVADVENQSRALLGYCGLDWQPDVLRFYESSEASTTASTVQVRQPVYTSSVGIWKQYREQLTPLIRVLEDAGIDLHG